MPRTPDTSDGGIERLQAVVRANPRSTAFVALSHALCEAGRASDAEEVCREGLSQHPRLVTGQVALGRSLVLQRRLLEAQEVLTEAAKAGPEHADAFRWLAEVALARSQTARARALLEYADDLSPGDDVIGHLLVKAGGNPLPRLARPKSDFEDTRISNARALADRMHEEPQVWTRDEAARGAPGPRPAGDDPDEPTVVGGDGTPAPWPPFADSPSRPPPVPLPAPEGMPGDNLLVSGRHAAADLPRERGEGVRPAATPFRGLPARPRTARKPGWTSRWPLVAGALALAIGAGWMISRGVRRAPNETAVVAGPPQAAPPPVDRRPEILALLEAGTVEGLQRAEELSSAGPSDPTEVDGPLAARLAFANALLGHEYGLRSHFERARVHLGRAQASPPPQPPRLRAHLAAAQALLALEKGRVDQGATLVDASALDRGLPEVAFTAARVRWFHGDLEAARAALAPEVVTIYAPARLEAAALALAAGEGEAAKLLVAPLVKGQGPTAFAAELLDGDAERLGGRRVRLPGRTCREVGRLPRLHAACSLSSATEARLAGARASALRAARAGAGEAGAHVRLLGRAALLLATLGEVDRAAALVERASGLGARATPELGWARVALALGRGEPPAAVPPGAPGSPEARVVAARLVIAREPGAVLSLIATWPPAVLAEDDDLRALAALGRGKALPPAELKWLSRQGDRGDPVAAYVLGRLALERGAVKDASRHLTKALAGHGDACRAIGLLRALPNEPKPGKGSKKTKKAKDVDALAKIVRADNASCVHLPKPAR